MVHPRYGIQASGSERQFLIVVRHDNPVVNDSGEELIGAPLDSESIVKRKFGKIAYGTQIGIGIEQLLHPQIGAAVEHTKKFWSNPYNRVAVSMDPIMSVVYADDPYMAGDHVRRFHEGINGVDYNGNKFNALSPDAFYWAHETFRRGVENLAEQYSPEGLSDAGKEQLQLESATWFSYYGMPMNMVPADREANVAYRKHAVDHVLEMNPSAERAIDLALDRQPPRAEAVPRVVWPLAKLALMPVTEMVSIMMIGELPADIRTKFGIPFSRDDQKRLDELRSIIKTFESPLPTPLQYLTVYDAVRRDRGGEHKSVVDRATYAGISVGKEVAKRTVVPLFKRAQKTTQTVLSSIAS